MRRFPSSWSETLARLGFRRNRRRQHRRDGRLMLRRSQLEPLEQRMMLASDLYTVTTLADAVDANDGFISLREALSLAANDGSTSDNDVIRFDSSLLTAAPPTISLTYDSPGGDILPDELLINSNLTIDGPGSGMLTIDGGTQTRIFRIATGVTATIRDVTLNHGKVIGTERGAAIKNEGDLTLSSAVVANSTSVDNGGGISTTGKLRVINSSFTGNTANVGGAIHVLSNAAQALVVENSTFSGNHATNHGGAIRTHGSNGTGTSIIINSTFSGNTSAGHAGAIVLTSTAPPMTIINSTITQNQAVTEGGGLYYGGGTFILFNTIVANNTSGFAHSDDILGTISSLSSNNLLGADESFQPGSGNIFTDATGLGPLGDHGGPTKTHGLASTSPAVDKGSNAKALDASNGALVTDQRGFARRIDAPAAPSGEIVDIGAFEYGAPLVVSTLIDELDSDYSAGDFSLREALSLTSINTITFDPKLFESGPATILLTYDGPDGNSTPDYLFTNDTIIGPGADLLTISGGGQTRVFYTFGATFERITITGGNSSAIRGRNYTLRGVRVVGNSSSGPGGGLWIQGRLTLIDSEISGNTATSGGGIYHTRFNEDYYPLTIINSTISGNTASVKGGGLFSYAVDLDAAYTRNRISNSTISGNQAPTGSGVFTQQVWGTPVLTEVYSSIIVDNTSPNGAISDWQGLNLHSSSSHNLLRQGASGGAMGPTNIVLTAVEDAGLLPLASNGGPTKTHALLPTSKAIDKGRSNWTPALSRDQRGFIRSVDQSAPDGTVGYTDIGAFEQPGPFASGDFNGDGRIDQLAFDSPTATLVAYFATSDGPAQPFVVAELDAGTAWGGFKVGDFNGDGRDDLLLQDETSDWYAAISESTQFIIHNLDIAAEFWATYVGDFDGDGSDELLAWEYGAYEWQMLHYDERIGATLDSGSTSWGSALSGYQTSYSSLIHVADANHDGRDDLIVKDIFPGPSLDHWLVGLSQVVNGTDSFVELDWGDWFDGYLVEGELDADGPYQRILDEFAWVYNNVELEFYEKLMKGPTATKESRGGNDWDQAALLVDKLVTAGFDDAQIVSDIVDVDINEVLKWVGAKSAYAALMIIRSAFDENAVAINASNVQITNETAANVNLQAAKLRFNHAWVQVAVPNSDGLETIDLDPSWKFKNYQDGIDLQGEFDLGFDEFGFIARAGSFYDDHDGTQDKELAARQLPLEYFEDRAMVNIVADPLFRGSSLADVPYDGAIDQVLFQQLPNWDYASSNPTEHGTLEDIIGGPELVALTHRVRLSFGTAVNATVWDWEGSLAEFALSSIVVENRSSGPTFTSTLIVDGQNVDSAGTLSSATPYRLFIDVRAPGESSATIVDNNVGPNETLVVALGVGQFSTKSIGDKLAAALDVDDVVHNVTPDEDGKPDMDDLGDFLSYGGAKYWYDVDTSSDAIAGLTRTARIRGVSGALLRAGDDLDPSDLDDKELLQTPFNLFPTSVSIDAFRIANGQDETVELAGGFLDIDNGTVNEEAVQLFVYQYSALEHSIMEELTAGEGASAAKLLQMAYSKVPNAFNPGNDSNSVRALRLVVDANDGNKVKLYLLSEFSVDEPSFNPSSAGVLMWTSVAQWTNSANWISTWNSQLNAYLANRSGVVNDASRFIAALETILDDGTAGYPGGDIALHQLEYAERLAEKIADQLRGVSNTGTSFVLVPEGLVRVGDSGIPDSEYWVGSGFMASHPGGRYKAAVLPLVGEFGDGGAGSGDINKITQPEGSFIYETSSNNVGTANGNVSRTDTDIFFPNGGVRMDFIRTYNSQSKVHTEPDNPGDDNFYFNDVGLGAGWTHSFSDRLVNWEGEGAANPDVVWLTSDGNQHYFNHLSGNSFATPPELSGDLKYFEGATPTDPDYYVFFNRNGSEHWFEKVTYHDGGDSEGELRARLVRTSDANGHGFSVSYNSLKPQQIVSVQDAHVRPSASGYTQNGRLAFYYGNDGAAGNELTQSGDTHHINAIQKYIQTPSGEQLVGTWHYNYGPVSLSDPGTGDNGRRLTSASSALDGAITSRLVTQYQYYSNEVPQPTQGLLKKVIEADGQYRTYEYYHNGRAFRTTASVSLGENLGSPNDDITTSTLYVFNFVQDRSQVIDSLNRVEAIIHQDNGLETRQIHADRTRNDTTWGVYHNNAFVPTSDYLVTATRDEIGAVQKFQYELHGSNHPFDKQLQSSSSSFFVDAAGEALASEVDGIVYTRFAYQQPASKPYMVVPKTVMVDATSSTDTFTSYSYDQFGNPVAVVDPLGRRTQYAYYTDADVAPGGPFAGKHYLVGKVKSEVKPNDNGEATPVTWRVLHEDFLIVGTTLLVKVDAKTGANEDVSVDAVRIDRIDGGEPFTRIVDDSDGLAGGFSIVSSNIGSPVNLTDPEYKGGLKRIIDNGDAYWSFAGLAPGRYRISTTWTSASDQDETTLYEIDDPHPSRPGIQYSREDINQRQKPGDSGIHFADTAPLTWYELEGGIGVSGSELRVVLNSGNSNGVIADAIRIDRIDEQGIFTQIIDNSHENDQSGTFATTGTTGLPDEGGPQFEKNAIRLSNTGSATWTFKNLIQGTYRVSATWTRDTTYSSNAQYVLTDVGHSSSPPISVNQQRNPAESGTRFGDHELRFIYDAAGSITETRYEGAVQKLATFDHNGNPLTSMDSTGRFSVFTSDILGRQRTAGIAENNGANQPINPLISTHEYDKRGRRTATIDPLGHKTQYAYDARGLVTHVTNRDGTIEEYTYDAVGNMISRSDELGRTTRFFYDGRNRLVQTLYPDGSSVKVRYDGTGRVTRTIDELGNETSFEYDAEGRLLTTTNAKNDTATSTYDDLGRVTSATDFEGHVTLYEYDLLNRGIQTRVLKDGDNPENPQLPPVSLSTTEYDVNGNVIRSIMYDSGPLAAYLGTSLADDAAGLISYWDGNVGAHPFMHAVEMRYDTFNRLTETMILEAAVDSPEGDVVSHTFHDGAGRVLFSYDELGRKTEIRYDGYGRLEETILPDPDGNPATLDDIPTVSRTYDAAGNVLTVTDANGNVATNTYDIFNRPIASTDAEGNTTRSVFDVAGQAIAAIDALGRTAYMAYDNRGRVRFDRGPDPDGAGPMSAAINRYEYDFFGNRKKTIASNGHETKFEYDKLNRLEKELSTDFRIEDDSTSDDGPTFYVASGVPVPSNSDIAFGGDHTTIEPDIIYSAEATWHFSSLHAGTYRVALTWQANTALAEHAEVQIYVGGNDYGPFELNQRQSPSDLVFDHQGRSLGWKVLDVEIEVNGPTHDVDIWLRAGNVTDKISADAVMLTRVIERKYEYDDNGNVTKDTDALGRETDFTYDELNRLVTTTLPDPDGSGGGNLLQGRVSANTYDGYGNVIQTNEYTETTEQLLRRTLTEYDKRNRVVSQTVGVEFVPPPLIHWKLDASGTTTAVNSANPGQYDGTVDGAATWVEGVHNNGLRLNSTTKIQTGLPYNPIPGPQNMTIAAWAKLDTADTFGSELISIGDNIILRLDEPGPGGLRYTRAYIRSNGGGWVWAEVNKTFAGKGWHHFAATFDDANNVLKLYIDGELANPKTTTFPLLHLAGSTIVGRHSTSTDFDFTGTVDDVRVYDYALSAAQISEVYGLAATTTKFEYDDAGNLARKIEAYNTDDEVITKYEYDELNRQTSVQTDVTRLPGSPAPNARAGDTHHSADYEYDPVGNLKKTTTTVGHFYNSSVSTSTVSTFEYDNVNRLVSQIDDFGVQSYNANAEKRFVYDAVGNVVQEYDPTDRLTTHTYDRLNRVIKTTSPESAPGVNDAPTTAFVYDVLGNVAKTTNGEGETTQSVFDPRGRQIIRIDGNGDETRYQYDAVGNQVQVIDGSGNVTQFQYDNFNRMVRSTIFDDGDDNLPLDRIYRYNDKGNLDVAIDRNGRATKFTYDVLDRLTEEGWYDLASDVGNLPLRKAVLSFRHDTLGRVVSSRTFGAGVGPALTYEETFTYDNLGRVTQRNNYDVAGLNPRVQQSHIYDLIDLAKPAAPFRSLYSQSVESSPNNFYAVANIIESQDYLGRTIEILDIVGGQSMKTITFDYDAAGRVLAIERAAAPGFNYDTSYSYDGVGRVRTIAHRLDGATATFAHYMYDYDSASRIVTHLSAFDNGDDDALDALDALRSETFSFDLAGQLKNRTASGAISTDDAFAYDSSGNRISANGDDYEIGANNRLEDDEFYYYYYDDEGNLKTRVNKSTYETTSFTWDHRNRLVQVQVSAPANPVTTTTQYVYDNNDLRVRKSVSVYSGGPSATATENEQYVYNGDQVVLAIDRDLTGTAHTNGYLQNRYLYAPGIDELLSDEDFGGRSDPGTSVYDLLWAATDHMGSARQLIDDAESIVEHREYDSFGQIKSLFGSSGATKNLNALDSVFAFAGREWDNQVGLYYNRARWFDPRIGRFMSEDPLGFEGGDTNLYRYANNDPFDLVDPSGQSWLSSAIKKIGKKIDGTIEMLKFATRHPKKFINNLDDMAKDMAKDPMFWVTLAIGPLFAVNVTWGAFNYGFGLGGFSFNTNFLKLGTDTFRFLAGQGMNLGMPSFSVTTPLFNFTKSLNVAAIWPQSMSTSMMVSPAISSTSSEMSGRIYDPNIQAAQYMSEAADFGHHFNPQQVIEDLQRRELLTQEAYDVAMGFTSGSTLPPHRFSEAHGRYNVRALELANDWVDRMKFSNANRITGDQMKGFIKDHLVAGVDLDGKPDKILRELNDIVAEGRDAMMSRQNFSPKKRIVDLSVDELVKRGQAFQKTQAWWKGRTAGAAFGVMMAGIGQSVQAMNLAAESPSFHRGVAALSAGNLGAAKRHFLGHQAGNSHGGFYDELVEDNLPAAALNFKSGYDKLMENARQVQRPTFPTNQ